VYVAADSVEWDLLKPVHDTTHTCTAAYQHLLVAHVCTAVGWLRWEVGLCLLMYVQYMCHHSAYIYVHVLYMCICVMADITVAHSVVGI
jgi:hypothetical protein